MKITDIFNNPELRKKKRMLDIRITKAERIITELKPKGVQETIKSLRDAYAAQVKALYANVDPTAPVVAAKKATPAKKAAPAKKKSAPAKKSGSKKVTKPNFGEVAGDDMSDLTD